MEVISPHLFILMLLSPLCLATWDDKGYQQLCGIKYKCSCPDSSGPQSYIDCALRNISELPTNIYFPGKIEKVIFQNNRIRDILDYTFYNGHGVAELDLSYNRIKYIASSSFVAFEKLTILHLSQNELSTIPVKLLDGLSELRTLDLGFNKLQAFLSNVFEPVPRLEVLKLKFNPLLYLDDTSFEHLPNLEKLELENTGLTKLPDNIFYYTPRLRSLSLASNAFNEIPSRALNKCGELKLLDISENFMKIIRPGAFYGLNNLTVLYMNGQRELKSIQEGAFGDLSSLQILQCSYNTELTYLDDLMFFKIVGDETGAKIIGPLRIEQLHMRDNALEYINERLLSWKDLFYLDLRGNPFRCDCELRWMAELPNNLKENIRCASPSSLANTAVSHLNAEEFVCVWYIFTDNAMHFTVVLMLSVFMLCWVLLLGVYFLCKLKLNVKANRQRGYTLVVPKTDRIDLEWDHSADP